MAPDTLQMRLAQEAGPVNHALEQLVEELPASCQPIAKHVLQAGGKRLRPFLTLLCYQLLGGESEDVYRLASSMELLHAATLLHDDILDSATSRRGQKAAHLIFGVPKTILAGDAMLALGNDIIARFQMTAMTQCYSLATIRTAAGEILEMDCLRRADLGHDDYIAIASGKTACLIAQACAIGAHFANAEPHHISACATFGENLGIAFQLVDDALDFAPESQTGKPMGGDLREGKLTTPLRLFRESLDEEIRQEFDKGFTAGNFTEDQLNDIAAAASPFARESLKIADAYLQKARSALDKLPGGAEKDLLADMADYVRNRSK